MEGEIKDNQNGDCNLGFNIVNENQEIERNIRDMLKKRAKSNNVFNKD